MATDLAISAVFAINCESRIADRLQSKPATKKRKREKCWKKLYIIIKANGPQTCPSNDDDDEDEDEDDAAVSIPVPVPVPVDADDDDEP